MQVLHGDPVGVDVLAELEDGRDVRMRDARGDARLVDEHVDEGLVLDEVRVDPLDGDPLLETAGAVHSGKVNAGHAADADLVDHAVASEEIRSTFEGAPAVRTGLRRLARARLRGGHR